MKCNPHKWLIFKFRTPQETPWVLVSPASLEPDRNGNRHIIAQFKTWRGAVMTMTSWPSNFPLA